MRRKLSVLILICLSGLLASADEVSWNKNIEMSSVASDEAYLDYRVKLRRVCFRDVSSELHSAPDRFNSPNLILPSDFRYRDLLSMERVGYKSGNLRTIPWSGDYWPYYKGLLAHRFTDPTFKSTKNWKTLYNYSRQNPARNIYYRGNSTSINALSPSEKYDLLSGADFLLTEKMWQLGQEYHVKYGTVEEWMGLCHGWAAASILTDGPKRSVQMIAFDNRTRITFFPDEIKGLLSYAWANAQYSSKYAGRRCSSRYPSTNYNGRINQEECNDLNPATWHMVVVNQISDLKQSFIMDATYNYEVWNYPVYAYEYNYINVRDRRIYNSLSQAKVHINGYRDDPFRGHRSPGTRYIVGIGMKVWYVRETTSLQLTYDPINHESQVMGYYYYDLELDENGRILGGEWRQQNRPDFIWKPTSRASAVTYFDSKVNAGELTHSMSLNNDWKRTLNDASSRGLLVYKLVDYLRELSD